MRRPACELRQLMRTSILLLIHAYTSSFVEMKHNAIPIKKTQEIETLKGMYKTFSIYLALFCQSIDRICNRSDHIIGMSMFNDNDHIMLSVNSSTQLTRCQIPTVSHH